MALQWGDNRIDLFEGNLSIHVYDSILVHDVIILRHDGMPVSSISGSHSLECESIETDIETRFKKMMSTDKDTVVDMKAESYYKLHLSSRRLLGVIPQLQPRGTYVGGQIVGCL